MNRNINPARPSEEGYSHARRLVDLQIATRRGWDDGESFGFRRGFFAGALCGVLSATAFVLVLTELLTWISF